MDLNEQVKLLIQQATLPLEQRIKELEEQIKAQPRRPKEVKGVGAIVRWCNIPRKEVTELANSGALGTCIWKHLTESKKGTVICLDIDTASRRYRKYANSTETEKSLWRELGVEMAEREWTAEGF